jgi:putative copper export protein
VLKDTGGEPRRLLIAIPVFSQLAVLAVGALVVSGVVLARLHLTHGTSSSAQGMADG